MFGIVVDDFCSKYTKLNGPFGLEELKFSLSTIAEVRLRELIDLTIKRHGRMICVRRPVPWGMPARRLR